MLKRNFNPAKTSEQFDSGSLKHLIGDGMVITGESDIRYPFGFRTVGVKRFFDAQVAGETVDTVVVIPMTNAAEEIHVGECVEILPYRTGRREIFKVIQKQYKYDAIPQAIYLSLTSGQIDVTDEREAAA